MAGPGAYDDANRDEYMVMRDSQFLTTSANGHAPVAATALFSRYYFWYSFSFYRRLGA